MSAPAALAAFRRRTARALADTELHGNLRRATGGTLAKRRALLAALPSADADRHAVAAARHADAPAREALLGRAVAQMEAAGFTVHHAADAAAARGLVLGILRDAGARRVVKSKSMITEEIELNAALEAAGLDVVETDLGEFIVQQLGERPSHITAPALHLNRRQIGALFVRLWPDETPSEDPATLTAQARRHLRERFLAADAGITGANFVIAETGSLVLVENEGNIGLCSSVPPLHIALAGIEKVLPRLADLDPLLRLLPANATGQRAGSYVSLINGPAPVGDGPTARHVIFVDNGRRALAASPEAEILACLRCGSCLNVCPCFRHAGGHSYGTIYPGPMGILQSPYLAAPTPPAADGRSAHRLETSLADVCSLCGACAEICPAEIPLPDLIWRARVAKEEDAPAGRRAPWRVFAALSARPRSFRLAAGLMRVALRVSPALAAAFGRAWSANHALPPAPPRSFAAELRRRHPERIR
ncbi:MAG: lactate utilization protein [Candidatus Latescibacteria bacterium]|nr:lactate utilization protein [Candidatus Latescibacterota bacterium]